jgi:hypothetical protein
VSVRFCVFSFSCAYEFTTTIAPIDGIEKESKEIEKTIVISPVVKNSIPYLWLDVNLIVIKVNLW